MAQCFPVNIIACVLYGIGKTDISNLKELDYTTEWDVPFYVFDKKMDYPTKIVSIWYSCFDNKFYFISNKLNADKFDHDKVENTIAAIFPQGLMAIWLCTVNATKLLLNCKANDVTDYMLDLIKKERGVVVEYDSEDNEALEIDLFDNYMKQFTYRYLPMFEHWNEDEEKWQPYTEEEQETKPELDYIEEALYDGTHDKLHDGGLLNYHEAGKPKKLAVKWHIKKSEYTAYFWFEDEAIRAIYDKFYGIHPDTKTDFILHIDPEKKKYQLALYRYGLQEPRIIPEDAYQLIVFKNKFEHFRSENYDQPRGAWIW